MQLLRISKKVIDKNKDGEIVPRLETVEVVLVHCNLVNNNYQQASKVLFNFLPNKQLGQLITITPHSLKMLKTKMRFSLEPTYRRYVKGFGFVSFARKSGDKYGKKLMNTATKTGINAAKKFGDKYGKNLMDTAKNKGVNLLKLLVKE